MIDFRQIRALSFDCYGTLIDWERGIVSTLTPLLQSRGGRPFSNDELLEAYARAESRIEAGPYLPYRDVLAQVTSDLATHFRATLRPGDAQLLAPSIVDWPAFSDTASALARLAKSYQFLILSNIDRNLFELSRPKLGASFAHIITAEDVHAYKPAPLHFHEASRRTGLAPGQVCHVAQSLFHDITVAAPLGFHTVWINRRRGQQGPGATPPAAATPDLEFPDLESLAKHISDTMS